MGGKSKREGTFGLICLCMADSFRCAVEANKTLWSNRTPIKINKKKSRDFPGGAVVKNPPANAGDMGLSPGPGRRSRMPRSSWAHAPQLLSLRSGAHEPHLLKPVRLEPVLHRGRAHSNEKPTRRSEAWRPLAATRESPRAATKTQRSQKLIN